MSFKDMTINFLIIGLFAFSLFSFAYTLGTENDIPNFLNNDYVNLTGLNESLTGAESIAQSQRTAVESEKITTQIGEILFGSVWGTLKVISSSTIGIFNTLFDILVKIFHIPPIVLGVITAILIISLLFYGYRLIKMGE